MALDRRGPWFAVAVQDDPQHKARHAGRARAGIDEEPFRFEAGG